ncbi:MAG: hypothetical protein CME68_01535 [Halobacteriovoraceae bacterium]|nr:hypothetical protein [Halobacteriovoraceae bacterium]|tara:strand:+ start:170 stop:610 length:441 start_codon:yes stop_codon:yes gene_type:complete
MKESKKKDPSLPTSLNLTAEIGEFLKDIFKLLSFILIYIMRHLFFKKSVPEDRSFLHLFGEDLCFSFGKSLVTSLAVLSFVIGGASIDNFFLHSIGSFVMINLYLIFFRFNFYLRWIAFIVFFTFFFLEAINLTSKRGWEARFEQE